MKIVITNIVTLNGGDFAILDAMMNVLKRTYGEDTEFIVYDHHPDVAVKYYPAISYRKLLYLKYPQKSIKGLSVLNKILKQFSTQKRLMLAAEWHAKGKTNLADLILTAEEKVDFYNYINADLVVSSGGTYLVENYSLGPRFYDYYFTLALNKPLVFFTQSLGPFKKPFNRTNIKKIFDKAALILLRDKASYNNLKDINVDVTKAKVCADVVFSDTSTAILEAAKTKETGNPLRVGISVRDWKFFVGRTQEEGLRKYFLSVAAICEYVVKELKGEIVFISTCQAIKEYHVDDSKTAGLIYDLLSAEAKAGTSVNSDFHTPGQLKEVIRNYDLVISTRMHAAIQSLNLGVPVLPIAYEFKTKELFSKLIDTRLILDIDKLEEEHTVEVFKQFLAALPATRANIFERVKREHLSALEPVKYLKEFVPVNN